MWLPAMQRVELGRVFLDVVQQVEQPIRHTTFFDEQIAYTTNEGDEYTLHGAGSDISSPLGEVARRDQRLRRIEVLR